MSDPGETIARHRSGWTRLREDALGVLRYVPLLVVVVCNLPGLRNVHDAPIAGDPDTPAILEAIREDTSATGLLGWFARDWPLGNGFYRPVVALSLAADSALYGDCARGYRATSWLLALVCSLAVYWLIAALTGSASSASSRIFAGCAAAMFALRQSGRAVELPAIVQLMWSAVILMGLAALPLVRRAEPQPYRRFSLCLFTVCAAFVLVVPDWRSYGVVVSWIAARTVLLGALFSVLALGCFVKALDAQRRGWLWATLVMTCLALCSYEQSVMLPFAAAAILIWHEPRNRPAACCAIALMGLALVLYLALRLGTVGGEVTTYHQIQAKTSVRGTVRALADYVLPVTPCVRANWARAATSGRLIVLDPPFWVNLALVAAWITAYVRLCRMAWRAATALWLVKALTFLPMAFLHVFPRYYYLPEAAACALGMAALWPGGVARPGAQADRQ